MRYTIKELALRQLYVKRTGPFDTPAGSRIPAVYRKYFEEHENTTKQPVHYIPEPGKWKRDPDTGLVSRIQNVPLPHLKTPEFDKVLSGGEMVISGFQKRKPRRRRVPHFWVPNLKRSVVYSEILDQYMSVICTDRLIDLIHQHQGFDYYLLQTHSVDLHTDLAIKMKRKVLLALRDKTMPYDDKKKQQIFDKYKEYMPPDDEIEWYGLTYIEALNKQKDIDREIERSEKIPFKQKYRLDLLEHLKEAGIKEAQPGEEKKSTSWLAKIKNPFSSKTA